MFIAIRLKCLGRRFHIVGQSDGLYSICHSCEKFQLSGTKIAAVHRSMCNCLQFQVVDIAVQIGERNMLWFESKLYESDYQ